MITNKKLREKLRDYQENLELTNDTKIIVMDILKNHSNVLPLNRVLETFGLDMWEITGLINSGYSFNNICFDINLD